MAGHKNIIKVEKDKEKRLYQIMHEIEKNNECLIHDASSDDWHQAFRQLGRRGENLFNDNLLEFWKTDPHSNENKRLIRINKDVEVIRKNGVKIDNFIFRRRRII